ncbi:MAG: indolepyruvate ferredoxin oxidoreductase subunit alpha, partial [Anaerolineae bacterium]|nr:indolepyruvate ferredoxin oxidoreductase subunit alpha [Anaerolineae bacterium]
VASAYPGTPSTEILEEFARFPDVYAEWATNEKVALDVAIGAAYAGKRAFTSMKHVGLNVAADAFMYASMTGIEAGLVIITADDPAMHSSQNEQDNRTFAKFARIPCLEPSNSQEAKDMMSAAFEISEQFDTPVLLRMTTRICHSTSAVKLGESANLRISESTNQRTPVLAPERSAGASVSEAASGESAIRNPQSAIRRFPRNPAKYVMVPGNARPRHPIIEQRMRDVADFAETLSFNRSEPGERRLGIITAGVAYEYAREIFPKASVLRLGMTWPLPAALIRRFAASVERLIVVEELDPFIEEAVRLLGIPVEGKSIFPITGEFDPRVVRECAIKAGLLPEAAHVPMLNVDVGALPVRPPVLCPGCPHRSTFYVLNKLKALVLGDIGCYSLGLIPPLSAMHTLGCMGAGIGVAHGAAKAGNPEHHVAVIGDSTFFHTGLPALANVVYNQSPIITIIMDNRVTGMTGHQDNPGTGRTLQNKAAPIIEIEPVVRALGVKQVKTVGAYAVDEIEATLKQYMQLDEPSVLITLEPCALLPEARRHWHALAVDSEKCNGCTLCFRVGCPAILKSAELDARYGRPKAEIDPLLCTGCEVCSQVCPREAISVR